jgi:hypothetical protein
MALEDGPDERWNQIQGIQDGLTQGNVRGGTPRTEGLGVQEEPSEGQK